MNFLEAVGVCLHYGKRVFLHPSKYTVIIEWFGLIFKDPLDQPQTLYVHFQHSSGFIFSCIPAMKCHPGKQQNDTGLEHSEHPKKPN